MVHGNGDGDKLAGYEISPNRDSKRPKIRTYDSSCKVPQYDGHRKSNDIPYALSEIKEKENVAGETANQGSRVQSDTPPRIWKTNGVLVFIRILEIVVAPPRSH